MPGGQLADDELGEFGVLAKTPSAKCLTGLLASLPDPDWLAAQLAGHGMLTVAVNAHLPAPPARVPAAGADRRTLVRSGEIGEIGDASRPPGRPPRTLSKTDPRSFISSILQSMVLVKSGQPFYIDLMPRVSDEHLERRRRQIMDAALRCFARKGFHETSMQDVFRESGLSAGAVYRYFKSKNELVQAITAGETAPVTAIIQSALAQDPIPGADEIAGRQAAAAEQLSGPDGPARVAPSAWAEALHDPAVADIVRGTWGPIRSYWITAAQRMRDDGRLPPGKRGQRARPEPARRRRAGKPASQQPARTRAAPGRKEAEFQRLPCQ